MLWEWLNSGKQVFILDLDGTLMPSAEIDNECFWQAVFNCFGKTQSVPNLHGFKHVTDSGILEQWCIEALGRSPRTDEVQRIKQRFFSLLQSAAELQACHFQALPGVINWLESALNRSNVFVGIATGGWQHTARLKLQLSGLDRFDLPLASSDDAIRRTEIMRIAAQRTLDGEPDDEAVFTYVGDGPWDLLASQQLGWSFIGIASGTQIAPLAQAGAVNIFPDFL